MTDQEPKKYVFDPTWDQETERLRANEALWDPGTIERLERVGVTSGWHALEVGAGSGSIARWLGERVGPTGRVLAADLEIGRLEALRAPHVEVAKIDIRTEELPAASFDVVHSRMVVQHLQDRPAAVASMVRALKPGGWLFLEDTDSMTLFRSATSEDFLQDVRAAGYELMRRSGHEPRGGHFDLQAALSTGLEEVSAEGRAVVVQGGTFQARHYQLWLEFMKPRLVAEGMVSASRVDEALAQMGDPAHHWLTQVLISTYGRKPR
ncbi:class I SAM-dependent methyltransferase [Streptomyces zagrosensis]|uniref:SAM-dependent methyltransferase n=1 Tax=Streptomyces zagrosensis TaxID=1042984 RepID=A0A7W9V058_9ACTN|nr:class I SAM-dependent methyltransferase [Streptomyces zagrosensis]MBB5936976.1 SAM-dependent methyltransferase [Streptomyces zagrosensis]